jgi:tol-pal system protein YbgF
MPRWPLWRALPLLALLAAPAAHAGLFDDDEARKQITALREQVTERLEKLDAASRSQLDLANQLEGLRADLAKLQGQIEVLTYENDAAQKRQRDFYIDLDSRLRKLESPPAAADKPVEAAAAKADPQAETHDYEAALNFFKGGKYKEAQAAFEGFLKAYPASTLAPSAQYWLGNTHYAAHDCKKAIEVQSALVAKWADSPKVPDALLSVATCQQELGDGKAARKTLDVVIAQYPSSVAADVARQRLKKK